MNITQHALYQHYDNLWQQTWPQLRRGQVALDPQLATGIPDQRRGLTMIARPAPVVAERITLMLAKLATIEPQQYYYPRADLHVTVLSLFTAAINPHQQLAQLAEYQAAVAAAIADMPHFTIDAVGITLSPNAVMIQGFPRDETLAAIRDRLRAELQQRGLGAALDQRYRLVTAHSTILRFVTALRSPEQFAQRLHDYRATVFGSSTIHTLDLVLNDWYMSSAQVRRIESFQLR